MHLPEQVRASVAERAEAVGFAALKRAAQALSCGYREGCATAMAGLAPEQRVAAYLATRMPGTYAAAVEALRPLQHCPVSSVLDIGAGAGAAALAASLWFPRLEPVTLIERDGALAEAAQEFLPHARIRRENFLRIETFPPHDLVVAAYSLGETPRADILSQLWEAARVALVVIEPGTPRGFALIRDARTRLLAAGAHMAAPCPAAGACPIADPDWCHFAARVERSALHRRLKEGALSYEDEKFSYVAVCKEPLSLAPARIIRRPRHQPGLIVLETCTPEGLGTMRITKRDRDRFRAARHAAWGDPFPRYDGNHA
ncbi:MAG TPA: small ribosomal subunit Rsm22 family protein [Bryobacteraceae bacterium]|nr:small ribosomal subunit Rsm22 family protein [Bryobacteraceae bacterium]